LFVEYNVSDYLQAGENIISIKLGNGFFNQVSKDEWSFYAASWRETPKMIFQVEIDGKCICVSDETWLWSQDGATIHNNIRTGEYYDARREDGWRELRYDDSSWQKATISAPPCDKLEKMEMPFIKECEKIVPVKKWKSSNGWIFDFGVNIAGYVSFKMTASAGTTISLRYAEKLNGLEIDQSNINCFISGNMPFSMDKYTFKGSGEEEWKPEFIYHGFQYVEVTGIENEIPMSALNAYFVHTDLPQKGEFSCSDSLLNWIYEAGIRAFLSNWHGIPEDCPHREKNGWTGDSALSCNYAVTLFEMKESYKKWLIDICDAQRDTGQLPGIVPTSGWGYNDANGPAWDCALFFLPFALYQETGDAECLHLIYQAGKKYLRYAEYQRKNGLVCYGLSDWCPPTDVANLRIMSNELSDSCYYYKMQLIMAEICRLKGKESEVFRYAKAAEETKIAIRNKYVKDDHVDNDGQGALAIVLDFKIVEGEQAERIARRLVDTLRKDEYVCKVGILGIKALFNALSAFGYTEDVYRALSRKEYPSYGYWREKGATTLWERWDGEGVASLNHHMYGSVLYWLFRNIGGIQNAGIAYNQCLLKPYFFGEKCSASSYTTTPNGKITFSWKKEENNFECEIILPKGINAVLEVGGEKRNVQTGSYTIKL